MSQIQNGDSREQTGTYNEAARMTSIAKVPTGVLRDTVLRALIYESRSLKSIQASISGHPSEAVERMLERLKASGLVAYKWRLWSLTKAGRNALPAATNALASQGRYVPPRVARRPGSEIHKRLPSRVGDQLHYREQA